MYDCTIISPVSVPRVGDQPVGGSLLSAPTKDPNGVTSKHLTTSVLVYTCCGVTLNLT